MTSYSPSAGSWGPGTGAGGGWGPAAAGAGLPQRTNGGGIQPRDLQDIPENPPRPSLTRSMTNAYSYEEAGFSNRTPPQLHRESRFSAHSEGEGDGVAAAWAPPPVRRTGTEHHGPSSWPEETDLEVQKERTRSSLRQLLYILQTEMERPRSDTRSHDEMAADDARWNELDEQIEAILRLLTALN